MRWLIWIGAVAYIALRLGAAGLARVALGRPASCIGVRARRRRRGDAHARLGARAGRRPARRCCPTSIRCARSRARTGGASSRRRRALLGVTHAVNAALVVGVHRPERRVRPGTLLSLTVPALSCRRCSGTARSARRSCPSSATSTWRCATRACAGRRATTRARSRPSARRSRSAVPARGLPVSGRDVRRRRRGRGRPLARAASTPIRRAGCWARSLSMCWRWGSTRRCCCATSCGRCSRSSARAIACPSPRCARR